MRINRCKKTALVIGDVMLDQYLMGKATRLCPEGPVPVVVVEDEIYRLGGAANVSAVLNALGMKTILVGVVGDDETGLKIKELAQNEGICFTPVIDPLRPTTLKKRILAQGKIIVRIDRESTDGIKDKVVLEMLSIVESLAKEVDTVVISDYDKGVVVAELVRQLNHVFKQKDVPVYVDPKGCNYNKYKGVYLVKPNFKELEQVYRRTIRGFDDMEKAVEIVFRLAECKICVVTWGEYGSVLFYNPGKWVHIPASMQKEVIDVTGAGDVFLGALAVAEATGLAIEEACRFANQIAARSVTRVGTGPAELAEWKEQIEKGMDCENKLLKKDIDNRIAENSEGETD